MAKEGSKSVAPGQRAAQIIQNRMAAQQEEPEEAAVAETVAEAPVKNIWMVDGCGGIYKRAAENWRKGWTYIGAKNESAMVAAFDDAAGPNDRMLIRDFRLIQEFGLTIVDETYVADTLVFVAGTSPGITSHPYLLEICGEYPVTHIGIGDEIFTAKTGNVGVLTTLSGLAGGTEHEVVKHFVEKFWVVK